jgi:hypothetical protein
MDTAHEILVMLRMRRYVTNLTRKLLDRSMVPLNVMAYFDAQHQEAAKVYQIARTIYFANQGGSAQLEDERARVVSISAAREEFVTFEDGYSHWWPSGSANGALSSWHLRVLADELDRRNRSWDKQVRKGLDRSNP